jgi:hypothetical protein
LNGRVVAVAAALAMAGAIQYVWNLRALWVSPNPPAGLFDGLATFWFDVTKSDWRETMVLQVPAGMTLERVRMYLFDVRQQFGTIALAISAAGAVYLARTSAPRLALLGLVWFVTVAFAFGYNVGDPYVFLLPSHLMLALLTAPGIAVIGRWNRLKYRGGPAIAAGVLLVIALARVYRDYPAMDRSEDHRPLNTLQALTAGIDDRNGLLLTDMNWQAQNGLTYFGRYVRPELAYVRAPEVMLYAPALIADNHAGGRDVLATAAAADQLAAAYGPLLRIRPDDRAPAPGIAPLARALPAGTRWVLCVLRPTREFVVDRADLEEALQILTGRREIPVGLDDYAVLAGRVGEPLAASRFSTRPFQERMNLQGVDVRVRMESWLAFDTIRRMGFGHVIADRNHTQIVERGVSFVAFDEDGRVVEAGYAAGIFAPQKRFIVSAMVDP